MWNYRTSERHRRESLLITTEINFRHYGAFIQTHLPADAWPPYRSTLVRRQAVLGGCVPQAKFIGQKLLSDRRRALTGVSFCAVLFPILFGSAPFSFAPLCSVPFCSVQNITLDHNASDHNASRTPNNGLMQIERDSTTRE